MAKKNLDIGTSLGATIDKLTDKIIILKVGRNDFDNGEDIESFREHYKSLIDTFNDGNKYIVVSGLLTRDSVYLEPNNNYDSFLLATGELVDSYYFKDKVHINMTSMIKLLENINKFRKVCNMQRFHRQHTVHNNFRQRQTIFKKNSQSSH